MMLHGLPLRRLLFTAAAVLPLGAALGACEPTRPYERVAEGPIEYLDQVSEAQKAEARTKIALTLDQGLEAYDLQIGDEFEIFFHSKRQPTSAAYVIHSADKLRIEFLDETDNNRVVQVRPDGRISVPMLGAVMAAGKTPDALARELEHRYEGVLPQAHVTVNETETHSPLDDLIDMLGPQRTRSLVSKVMPDGAISLPLLHQIRARGRTLQELRREIDAAYSAAGLDISVTLIPRNLRVGAALVLGEVAKPGRQDSDRPQTVLMTIAQAGGVLPTGSLAAVRVVYIGDDHQEHVRSINLKEVMEGRLEADMIVPKNAVIYVPPTELTKIGRLMDQVLRDVLRFQGFSIGGTYLLNNPSGGGTTVIQAP